MSNTIVVRRRSGHRWLMAAFALLAMTLGIASTLEFLSEDNLRGAFLAPMLGLGIAIILFISFWRFRILISDHDIIRIEIRTRRMLFSEIRTVTFDSGKLILHADHTSFEITTDVERKDEVFQLIVDRIKNLPNLKVGGDADVVQGYFSRKPDM